MQHLAGRCFSLQHKTLHAQKGIASCSCSSSRCPPAAAPGAHSSSSRHNRSILTSSLSDGGWGELTPDSSSSSSSSAGRGQGQSPARPGPSTTGGQGTRVRRVGQRDLDSSNSSSSRISEQGVDRSRDADSQDDGWYSDRTETGRSSSSSSSSSSRGPSRSSREGTPTDRGYTRDRQHSRLAPSAGAAVAEPRTARASLFGDARNSSSSSSAYGAGRSAGRGAVADHPDALPGDWVCPDCGDLNFARRMDCRSCEAPRAPRPTTSSSTFAPFTPQPGDWTCPSCSDVNFAWRTECRSCQEPRPKSATAGLSRGGYKNSSSSSSSSKGEKKVTKKKASSLVDKGVVTCYGCGAPLQTSVPAAAGYVALEKFEAKKKHKQLQQVLCGRCKSLAHGAMIPAVRDFTQKAWIEEQRQLLEQQQQQQQQAVQSVQQQDAAASAAGADDGASREPLELLGKVLVTAEELRDKIAEVSSVKALVVMLVDLLDMSGTLMGKVRDMVGNNPIVLVGTKMDLLPVGCSPKEVANWLTEAAERKRLQVTSTHLISSRSGEGVAAVASKIARERKGRDVFVVGAANVGKSAFVRALLKEMSSLAGGNFDAAAAATSRYLPVESAMPGTTLGIIPLKAFETGGTLYDTPGVHLHHRVPHMLTPDELRLLHPRRRLAPFSPPTPLDLVTDQQQDDEAPADNWKDRVPADKASSSSSKKPKQVSASYLWSGLVRIDVLSGPPSSSLVFFGPKSMRVAALPLLAEGQQVELDWDESADSDADSDDEHSSSSSSSSSSASKRVLLCQESVAARGGLVPHILRVPVPQIASSQCLADVAVSGLPGWVAVYAPYAKQGLDLRVWVPRGVEVFLRPPVPCPPPARPAGERGGVDGGVGEDDLVDIGAALDVSEADVDWELHRDQLGLRPMSAEDEEVMKMLLYGSEATGVTGIMDLEDEELEGLEEAEEDESTATAAAGGKQPAGDDDGDIAAVVARALQAESLTATAADALRPKRRSKVAGRSSSRRSGAQGLTIVDDEEDADVAAAEPGTVRRRRSRLR